MQLSKQAYHFDEQDEQANVKPCHVPNARSQPCVQKDVAVKLMKLKPNKSGKAGDAVSELPFTEAAIAGVCLHANIVQTLYADVRPIYARPQKTGGQGGPAPGEDDRAKGDDQWTHLNEFPTSELAQQEPERITEWQVRMVMECCDLGALPFA